MHTLAAWQTRSDEGTNVRWCAGLTIPCFGENIREKKNMSTIFARKLLPVPHHQPSLRPPSLLLRKGLRIHTTAPLSLKVNLLIIHTLSQILSRDLTSHQTNSSQHAPVNKRCRNISSAIPYPNTPPFWINTLLNHPQFP